MSSSTAILLQDTLSLLLPLLYSFFNSRYSTPGNLSPYLNCYHGSPFTERKQNRRSTPKMRPWLFIVPFVFGSAIAAPGDVQSEGLARRDVCET
jgi:hypothetical protein